MRDGRNNSRARSIVVARPLLERFLDLFFNLELFYFCFCSCVMENLARETRLATQLAAVQTEMAKDLIMQEDLLPASTSEEAERANYLRLIAQLRSQISDMEAVANQEEKDDDFSSKQELRYLSSNIFNYPITFLFC